MVEDNEANLDQTLRATSPAFAIPGIAPIPFKSMGLTLHAPDGARLLGFDNAHGGIKPEGARFLHAGKKYPYDHRHRHAKDVGVLYQFDTAYKLISDFYAEVDRVLKEVLP